MNDLKFACRQLLKNPCFTSVAVLTLALGMGINTTFFSAFNALALRPLQVKDPDTVVTVLSGYGQFSYPEYVDYRDHNEVLSGLVACAPLNLTFDGGPDDNSSFPPGESEKIRGLLVSGNYFSVLGAKIKDTRSVSLGEPAEPSLYLPMLPPGADRTPSSSLQTNIFDLKLFVRAVSRPRAVANSLVRYTQALDSNLRISASLLDDNIDRWVSPARLGALVSSGLGLMALLLASVGIYGMVAFAVGQRTREIGVHTALGAQRIDVLALVLRQALRPAIVGVAFGLGGSFAVTHALSRLLFGLSPLDPLTFLCLPLFLIFVAFLAAFIPARRATKIDPMEALRYE